MFAGPKPGFGSPPLRQEITGLVGEDLAGHPRLAGLLHPAVAAVEGGRKNDTFNALDAGWDFNGFYGF